MNVCMNVVLWSGVCVCACACVCIGVTREPRGKGGDEKYEYVSCNGAAMPRISVKQAVPLRPWG